MTHPTVRKATYAILENVQVNWASVITNNIIENKAGYKRYNPYRNLISTILRQFGVGLEDENPIRHPYSSVFDSKVLKAMKISATLGKITIEMPGHPSFLQDTTEPSSPHRSSPMHTSPSEAHILSMLEQ